MKKMHREQAIKTIKKDLNKYPELQDACLAIVEYLCAQPEQNLRHITFGALSRAAKLDHIKDVIPASRYLTGARVPILNLEFEFIEDDLIEPIPREQVSEARESGVFYHPVSGDQVENFENMLVMYFELSKDGLELRQN